MFTWEEAGLLRQMLLVIFWTAVVVAIVGVGFCLLQSWL